MHFHFQLKKQTKQRSRRWYFDERRGDRSIAREVEASGFSSLTGEPSATATEGETAAPTCACFPPERWSTSSPRWWSSSTTTNEPRGTTWDTRTASSGEMAAARIEDHFVAEWRRCRWISTPSLSLALRVRLPPRKSGRSSRRDSHRHGANCRRGQRWAGEPTPRTGNEMKRVFWRERRTAEREESAPQCQTCKKGGGPNPSLSNARDFLSVQT